MFSKEDKADCKKIFIRELRRNYSVFHAARKAGMSRRNAFYWRDADKEFAAQWKDAVNDAVDALEASAYERAMAGDMTLTIFMLKGAKPEKYKDRGHWEHSGRGGGPIEHKITNWVELMKAAGDEDRKEKEGPAPKADPATRATESP